MPWENYGSRGLPSAVMHRRTPDAVGRVLIIDEVEDLLTLLKQSIERMGLVAVTLSDSAKIMTTYAELKPDVVMLDPSMRHMDGMAIIEWLAHIDYVGYLVIMSGYPDDARVHKALAHARGRMAVLSLPKPFRLWDLRATLRAVTERGETDSRGPAQVLTK